MVKKKQGETPSQDFIAQFDRTRAMDSYARSIGNADSDALNHIQDINRQIQHSFTASITLSLIILIIAILILAASLYIFIANPGKDSSYQHIFSVICFIGSFVLLSGLIARNPLTNIKHMVGNFAKLNILFLGYVRQLNVIDATFRSLYISSPTFSAEDMEMYLEKVQDALDETIGIVNQLLDELEN